MCILSIILAEVGQLRVTIVCIEGVSKLCGQTQPYAVLNPLKHLSKNKQSA